MAPDRRSPAVLIAALPLLSVAAASAQTESRPGTLQGPEIEVSASVEHLFRTADDAVSREDWKLAIDSLQRVIDEPAGLLGASLGDDMAIYDSPRRHALGRLMDLPETGLAAYRVLYDGRAKGLIEKARRDMDLDAARLVCERYSMTRYGPEAVEMVSSWLLDVGQASRALLVIEEFLSLRPSGEGAPVSLSLKRAVALALMGEREAARSVLASMRTGADSGASFEELAGAVGAWIDQSFMTEPGGITLSEWSGPLGGGACTGVMDAVVPSFAENLPWRRGVPSLIPGVWAALDEVGPYRLPAMQPVASNGRLFVKAGRNCMALDLQSFATLWTSPSPVQGISQRARPEETLGLASEQAVLSDYVGNSLSVGGDLVLSVERGDRGPTFDSDGVAVLQRRRSSPSDQEDAAANRLAAYDARTGTLRWERGRRWDPHERLRNAVFLAPGVAQGEQLWVPFAESGDLYVGAFKASDGSLVRMIPLCALAGRDVNPMVALFPATADGYLYIPTGFGLFFAVDAQSLRVIWAHRYARSPPPPQRRSRGTPRPRQATHWLSGPPVLIGRVALLAPTDADRLLAIDRLTGELKWAIPRSRHQYIIAAHGGQAWLGGQELGAIRLGDGSYVWKWEAPIATGRAVLCGETVYVATKGGLIGLDAQTGKLGDSFELPYDQPQLGNLLCIGDSMISLDPEEVRAFPDRNSYEATLAAHRADPADARIAIRLAFMELLESRPQRALAALERVEPTDPADAELQVAHIAHLRVGALIQLAASPETGGDEAIAHLRKAIGISRDDRDLVAARLALGDRLRRLGRYAESYRTLWRLAVDPLGDEIAAKDDVRRPARLVIADMLARIEPELAPTEIEHLAREAETILSDAVQKLENRPTRTEAMATLRRLADSGPLAGLDQRALNALGRFEYRRGRYEPAEQYLSESLRRGSRPRETAAAAVALVDLYVLPAQSLFKSATDLLQRLSGEFGDVMVQGRRMQDHLQTRIAQIDRGIANEHAKALSVPMFELAGRLADEWPAGDLPGYARLVHTRPSRTEAAVGRQLLFMAPRTVRSYDVDTGALHWETELLMRTFGFDVLGAAEQETLVEGGGRWAFLDGQTAILNGPEGLHAVGLISGKRLWARPLQSAALLRDPVVREERTMDVGRGRVACMLSRGTLSVLRVLDGSAVWERPLENATFVRVRDEYVLTADAGIEEIRVFRLESGSLLSTHRFHQPGGGLSAGSVPVRFSAGVLCGPDHGGVVAYDVRTGDRLWSLELEDRASGLLEPTEGRFIIGTTSGAHKLVDARTGDVMFDERIENMPGGAVFGVLEDDIVVLAGYEETGHGDRWSLAGVEASSGRTRWSRQFLGLMNRSHLRLAEGVIPLVAVIEQEVADGARNRTVPRQQITLIDKRTGANVGDPVTWAGGGNRLSGEMEIWPRRVLLQTRDGIMMFRSRPAASTGTGVN